MPKLRSSADLRQEIKTLLDEAQAIVQQAEGNDGDCTPEELARVEEIGGIVGNDGNGNEPASGLWSDVARAEVREAILNQRVADRVATGKSESRPDAVVVPVNRHYRHSRLRAYSGPDADRNAYATGQWFAASMFSKPSAVQWCSEHGLSINAAMSEGANSLGGVLVPEETEMAIINLREERGVFRREAFVAPMASETKTVNRRVGGVTAYFGSEGDSMTASDKTFDSIGLTAKKLYALIKYSSELNEDALVSIGDDLTAEIAYAFADKEDECGFNGTGTSTYGGIVGVLQAMNAGSIYTAASGNTAFSTLDLVDFEGALGQLPQYAVANAKWYISRIGFYQSMARLADAVGGNTSDNLASGPNQLQFLGLPVVISQVLNSTVAAQASTAVLALGDLRQGATLGNRRGVSLLVSEHAYFANDQLALRGTERFDVNVHETGTASAAGSLIVMKTPAS